MASGYILIEHSHWILESAFQQRRRLVAASSEDVPAVMKAGQPGEQHSSLQRHVMQTDRTSTQVQQQRNVPEPL
jgi:hypothetical protein